MTFALAIWITLCVIFTAVAARELFVAERSYLNLLNVARSDDDITNAIDAWKSAQSFWLAAWSVICFTSGVAVYIVDMVSK